jgi:hypothetical protein
MDQIKARHGAPHSIGRACYIHRVLPESDAFLEYDQERLDQAKAEIAFDGLVADEHSVDEFYLPSCFGLPGAPDTRGGCSKCPMFNPCLEVEAFVCKKVAEKLGSEDPVRSRRKAQGRKRTARFRASKRRAEGGAKAAAKPG